MAVSYFFGNTMVDPHEMAEKNAIGVFADFNAKLAKGVDATIDFRQGSFSTKISNKSLLHPKIPKRTPIGIGKPFSIEILCVYTGNAPNKFFGGKKDILLVSGVRATNTHDEAPRAINQLLRKVEDYTYYSPSALRAGSPIVYYTSALDLGSILCSLELVADTFPKKTLDDVSTLLSKAAGIPVFATSSLQLLTGSGLVKMAGKIGNAIFESKAFMSDDLTFNFTSPDIPQAHADHIMLYNYRDKDLLKDYKPGLIQEKGQYRVALVHQTTQKEYQGDAPYVLMSIDGRNRDHELKGFSPRIAAASILEKFYGGNVESKSIEVIETAMTLYNDFKYHQKAIAMEKTLKQYEENSEAYQKAKTLLDAYKANIQNEQFKL